MGAAHMDLTPLTTPPSPSSCTPMRRSRRFVLGAVQLAGVKGTTRHRALGYTWVA